MKIDKDVYVPMRDGVALAVDLYRPDDLTSHAAVLVVTPYQKDARFKIPLGSDGRPVQSAAFRNLPKGFNPMLLSVAPLVDAGFVVAVADARGTGYSEGEYDYYNLEGGPFDGYDLVEWLAARPWCNGNIGMMGSSAAAIYCYITALSAPPHLAAMAPNMHPGDFYFDQWRIGGVFRWDNRIGWGLGMHPRTGPIDPGENNCPSYERKRAVFEARFHRYGARIVSGQNAANLDWLTDLYHRETYDEIWKRWSFLRQASQIAVPTLHAGVWFDHFIRGTITTHEAMAVPKRLFVAPGSLATRPELGDGGLAELTVTWFDHFLRGAENGVLDEPAARLYLMGREDYINEPSWPVPAKDTDLYLRAGPSGSVRSINDGELTHEEPSVDDEPDVISHEPADPVCTPRDNFDQRSFERRCLTFTSAPLEHELEVIGTPHLVLYASTDAPDVDWCVRLCDVDNAGRSRILNTGALKGSHVYSHEHPVPLNSGQVYRFEIEIWPIANLFRRGHRVRVDISTSDFPFFESNQHPSRNYVFHDEKRPSHLVLPVVDRR